MRGLLDADAPAGTSPFDHTVWVIASDGDLQEGVTSEASSLAGHQELGNLVVIYDENHISIEDDTDVAFTEDVLGRYEAYGWHTQRVDWTKTGELRRRRRRIWTPHCAPPRPRPSSPRSFRCAPSSAARRRRSRTPARSTAPRSAARKSQA